MPMSTVMEPYKPRFQQGISVAPVRQDTRGRRDITRQKGYDAQRHVNWTLFELRVLAVQQAQDAILDGEQGATWALRQALVDLASACECFVEKAPAPDSIDRELAA